MHIIRLFEILSAIGSLIYLTLAYIEASSLSWSVFAKTLTKVPGRIIEFDNTDHPIIAKGKTYQDIASRPNEWLRQWARIILVVERGVSPQQRLIMQKKYSQLRKKRILQNRKHCGHRKAYYRRHEQNHISFFPNVHLLMPTDPLIDSRVGAIDGHTYQEIRYIEGVVTTRMLPPIKFHPKMCQHLIQR
ncbi:unnamed protein product [Medioppia subpectinata]|uniref:Uncharacterized protein n=1 Tax=Medioppia subpectinata TaxID=1979941 RepID=A0A7R9KJ67_9ACAR|nr:unnamed protein product [Medioppia subpectinata]CAG2103152.1 unnamed protein product [Medioppia subpectinata]